MSEGTLLLEQPWISPNTQRIKQLQPTDEIYFIENSNSLETCGPPFKKHTHKAHKVCFHRIFLLPAPSIRTIGCHQPDVAWKMLTWNKTAKPNQRNKIPLRYTMNSVRINQYFWSVFLPFSLSLYHNNQLTVLSVPLSLLFSFILSNLTVLLGVQKDTVSTDCTVLLCFPNVYFSFALSLLHSPAE